MKPMSNERILDVGISSFNGRGTNFLELWYPYPEKIIAITVGNIEKFKDFNRCFPKVKLIFSNGKNLDFPDNHFDIVFF